MPRGGHVRLWGAGEHEAHRPAPRARIGRSPDPLARLDRRDGLRSRPITMVVMWSQRHMPRTCATRGAISVAAGQCSVQKEPLRALEQGVSAGGRRGLPACCKRAAVAHRGAKGHIWPILLDAGRRGRHRRIWLFCDSWPDYKLLCGRSRQRAKLVRGTAGGHTSPRTNKFPSARGETGVRGGVRGGAKHVCPRVRKVSETGQNLLFSFSQKKSLCVKSLYLHVPMKPTGVATLFLASALEL